MTEEEFANEVRRVSGLMLAAVPSGTNSVIATAAAMNAAISMIRDTAAHDIEEARKTAELMEEAAYKLLSGLDALEASQKETPT